MINCLCFFSRLQAKHDTQHMHTLAITGNGFRLPADPGQAQDQALIKCLDMEPRLLSLCF